VRVGCSIGNFAELLAQEIGQLNCHVIRRESNFKSYQINLKTCQKKASWFFGNNFLLMGVEPYIITFDRKGDFDSGNI
jgi:hypothetical protein